MPAEAYRDFWDKKVKSRHFFKFLGLALALSLRMLFTFFRPGSPLLRLTITADIKGYCPIGHLQTSLISDVGLYCNYTLWSIDTCQNKVSADQYHLTILRAQVESSSRSAVFFKLTADQVLVPIGSQAQAKPSQKRGFIFRALSWRLDAASTSSSKHLYSRRFSCLGGKRFGKNLFFLHSRRF